LYGNIQNNKLIYATLQKWLLQRAKELFPGWLKLISQQCQLSFNELTIRSTKSRWGSCSSKKNISLNSKLLFLPKHLVEHIFIHELCHTIHLNHSPAFWKLFKSFDANCEINRKAIKQAERLVPLWVD
jgi:predicted metal-dependent hydrolase